MSKLAVIAVGGNALIEDSSQPNGMERQYETIKKTVSHLMGLVDDGWSIVVTHGNGPQVGDILRQSEIAAAAVPPLPLTFCVAATQGTIGHGFTLAFANEFARRGEPNRAVTLLSDVEVDAADPAFANPTKPVGQFMSEAEATAARYELGWHIMEDSGRGYRRVVASPQPISVLASGTIRSLAQAGAVVVTGGGGGVGVQRTEAWEGVDCVIDKDRTSALLAREIGADVLMILTGVSHAMIGFRTAEERKLEEVSVEELRRYLAAGEFGAGSMAPKVEAVCDFVEAAPAGARAVISDLDNARAAVAGTAGTQVSRP